MLQALLHKKLKASFVDPTFKPSEDTLTSSVIGLLQYLPSDILSSILKDACGICNSFPIEIGDVLDIRFWEHWDSNNTTNSKLVEPDVLIVTEYYNIIVEAKRSDDGGQYREQWQNEIIAYRNSYSDDGHKLVVLALGGNISLAEQVLKIGNDSFTVFCASWFNLLHAISKQFENDYPAHIKRLLSDIINAFEIHGFFDIEWVNTLTHCPLNSKTVTVFSQSGTFSNFYQLCIPLKTNHFSWEI
ncbi:MAG: hypothetical protein K2N28_03880 [Muribaculaceae bacterium]|nr:hypothetical protein [Muribaculaceae bacterium]